MKKILSYTVFWLLQCTWGFIMTFIGAIVSLVLIIAGHKPKHIGPNVYFEIGENWGGFEMGPFFLCDKGSGDYTKFHECGHGIQNIILGPLFPFLVTIPSATRYWLRTMPTHIKKVIFAICYLIATVALTTLLAWIMTFTGIKALVIIAEVLRLYFLLVVIWMELIEIPRYERNEYVPYDSIWFEGQATKWGTNIYKNCVEKKED